jgi:hypothetical protein
MAIAFILLYLVLLSLALALLLTLGVQLHAAWVYNPEFRSQPISLVDYARIGRACTQSQLLHLYFSPAFYRLLLHRCLARQFFHGCPRVVQFLLLLSACAALTIALGRARVNAPLQESGTPRVSETIGASLFLWQDQYTARLHATTSVECAPWEQLFIAVRDVKVLAYPRIHHRAIHYLHNESTTYASINCNGWVPLEAAISSGPSAAGKPATSTSISNPRSFSAFRGFVRGIIQSSSTNTTSKTAWGTTTVSRSVEVQSELGIYSSCANCTHSRTHTVDPHGMSWVPQLVWPELPAAGRLVQRVSVL